MTDGYVNAWIVDDGEALVVIDTGLPAHVPLLVAAFHDLGRRPQDVVAVLLTHARRSRRGCRPPAGAWRLCAHPPRRGHRDARARTPARRNPHGAAAAPAHLATAHAPLRRQPLGAVEVVQPIRAVARLDRAVFSRPARPQGNRRSTDPPRSRPDVGQGRSR
ncbi:MULTISPECIES: MBL fold metallo-hydrolase [Prauserella]|uniref:MBL fold metallo-hydrolase n=1 Tax=Prauserella TaxID=142577 RepID=UPI003622CC1F